MPSPTYFRGFSKTQEHSRPQRKLFKEYIPPTRAPSWIERLGGKWGKAYLWGIPAPQEKNLWNW